MPTNKNAQLRYKVLDRCFGDSENLYSLEKLTEEEIYKNYFGGKIECTLTL